MGFRPTINSQIELLGMKYRFAEHPTAHGMLYGQAGRRGTVYQLKDSLGWLYALKVFNQNYQSPRIETSAAGMKSFSTLPGMHACSRRVLTKSNAPDLLKTYPDLEYAVLMDWTEGKTWQEVVLSNQTISRKTSLIWAKEFISLLSSLEAHRIAHCDISGPNVIVSDVQDSITDKIALVDVEDLYAPSLTLPGKLPAGSNGYGHKTAGSGIWNETADRFAGAILFAEMLTWHNSQIVSLSKDREQYFLQNEIHTSCDRYRVLHSTLKSSYGYQIADLFEQAWFSDTLSQCPPLHTWKDAIQDIQIMQVGPTIDYSPMDLNFGLLDHDNPTLTLTISNTGDSILKGKISGDPWISTIPDHFSVGRNRSVHISVTLQSNLIPRPQSKYTLQMPSVLHLDSNADSKTIDVKYVLPRDTPIAPAPAPIKMRGGCLSTWLIVVMLADIGLALFSIPLIGDSTAHGLGLLLLILSLGQLVSAGAILNWKKWGVYGFAVCVAFSILFVLGLGDIGAAIVETVVQSLLLFFLVKPAWQFMD